MPAIVPNVALGRTLQFLYNVNASTPTNSAIIILTLETAETLDDLRDYETVADILAAGGGTANIESAYTNYARITLDDADIVDPTIDHTDDEHNWTTADLTPAITAAGGGTDETIVVGILAYDPDTTGGTDSTLIPFHITEFASPITTDGSDINYDFPVVMLLAEDVTA